MLTRVTRRPRKLVWWIIGIACGLLTGLWIAAQALARAPILQRQLVQTLNEKLDVDVELRAFEVRTFPALRIHGDGLTLRLHGQTNPKPFIEVRHFQVDGGLWAMLRAHHRFRNVELDGLRITIPPRTPNDRRAGGNAASAIAEAVAIEHLQAKDAELVIVPRDPAKEPKVFNIHTLDLDSVGFNRSIPFTATLTNYIPKGEIATQGAFGPWVKGDPGSTPLHGRYSLQRAELNTIRGLSGTLTSLGDFTGMLSEIDVHGTTTTPDFALNLGGSPVPLDTTFSATVDGTNGDTYLNRVDARLAGTRVSATGAILSQQHTKGRSVKIDLTITRGRVEDLLGLAIAGAKPVMLGTLTMSAALVVPPGNAPVAERMSLVGRFALRRARFTDEGVQRQLASLSRRARGGRADTPIAPVASDMAGRFVLRNEIARFQALHFDVPGANVDLAGRYGLQDARLDFSGTLGMDAPVSKAVGGGIKTLLLKPLDPLFRKRGRGALLPITIKGPRAHPKFRLEWRKVFGSGGGRPGFTGGVSMAEFPVTKTDDEWRRILTPEQYQILRGHATERPGSCALNTEKRAGTFSCAGCGQELFTNETKFNSGTGWPSFYSPHPGAIGTTVDRSYGMTRTEVHCSRCGGHLGHVFPDGPPPTGERYCINGAVLTFTPEE